jgi:transposase InsO family protein
VSVTYMRIKQLFAWKGLKSVVHTFVHSCIICQQAKPDRSKSPGLLQPLLVPKGAWEIISMDFVEGLPMSESFDCIIVVVDKFTKYVHFLSLHHPFYAAHIAKVFIDNVYKLHGLPLSIVSDRDKIFTSKLWQELFALANVQLRMSRSYHHQSDGQTERVNQCLETYLRCFVHVCPKKWSKWLSQAEFWYNTFLHSAIGVSPFEALYGHPPRVFGISVVDTYSVQGLDDWLKERKVMSDLLQRHLHHAVNRMKMQADKGQLERTFDIGDKVFLKIQPYQITTPTSFLENTALCSHHWLGT